MGTSAAGRSTRIAALGLTAGAAVSVLGFLRISRWRPSSWSWAVHPAGPPDGAWMVGWGPTARSARWVADHALAAGLWTAAGLAVLVLAAGLLHLALELLSRVTEHDPEWALRGAVGATRRRVRSDLGREGLVVAGAGVALGLLLGWAGGALLRGAAPPGLALEGGAGAGAAAPGVPAVAGVVLVGALVAGAARLFVPRADLFRRPARRLAELADPATGGIGDTTVLAGPGGLEGWLLSAAQVAVAIVVGVGALLLARSAPRAEEAAGAYPYAHDTLVLRVTLGPDADRAAAWSAVRERLRGLPGVEDAAVASPGAFLGLGTVDGVAAECPGCSIPRPPVYFGRARHMAVGPGFFRLLGHPIRGGDLPPEGVAVDGAFDLKLLHGSPLGRTVWLAGSTAFGGPGQKVAAVTDLPAPIGLGAGGEPVPRVYLSAATHPPAVGDVAVRLSRGTLGGVPGAEDRSRPERDTATAIAAAAPGSRVRTLGTLAGLLRESLEPARWLGRMIAALALVGLLLAFGSVVRTLHARVRARRAEFGLRRAVGARRREILRLVFDDARTLILAGGAGGFMLGAGIDHGLPLLAGGLQPLPFGLLAVIAFAVALLGAAAALVAAWRLLRLEPAELQGT